MPLKDQIINLVRATTEVHPDGGGLSAFVRAVKPLTKHFNDDGIVPNNPKLPLVIYRRAVEKRSKAMTLDTVIDHLFAQNGWGRSWRSSIYDYVHYHSQVHEVLGIAKGSASVEFGGVKGVVLNISAGDIAILPAGTGHRLIKASRDFLVVGAYPEFGTYDECTDSRERPDAIKRIAKVRLPKTDPVYGVKGPLKTLWRRS